YRSLPVPGPRADVTGFVAARGRLGLAAGSLSDANAAHTRAVDHADTQREEWTEAAQRVSSLERLDERGRAEHEVEARRDEEKTVDDIVTGRYGRKQ
ncbi:MAG: flagellar export protein FliJ, partial [Actinomycetes bacterium]